MIIKMHLSASLDNYMGGLYLETRKYDLLNFWSSVSTDRAASDLMLEHAACKNNSSNARKKKRARSSNSRSDSVEAVAGGSGNGSFRAAADRLAEVYRRAEEDLEGGAVGDDEEGLFASGRGIGTGEPAGQRVLQVGLYGTICSIVLRFCVSKTRPRCTQGVR